MTATATEKKLLTTREAADELDVSVFTVRRLHADGVLPAARFTPRSRLRFRREDVRLISEMTR